MIDIKIKLEEGATAPTKAHPTDAGYDLYAYIPEPVVIYPGLNRMIPVGFSMAIPEGYYGGIYARSGLSCKQGLRPSNCQGIIDSSFRGNILVSLYNDSMVQRIVNPGDRIAQLIIQPLPPTTLSIVNELDETERGEGGFGSSGQ